MVNYRIKLTSNFKKSLKKYKKRNKDLSKLFYVMKLLENGEDLDAKYRDHHLINYCCIYDCRELHIDPDWLLIYSLS